MGAEFGVYRDEIILAVHLDAMASIEEQGKVCVVEVEEVVPTGSLDPDCIHLPGVYVQRMIVGAPYDKKIEFETTRERESA